MKLLLYDSMKSVFMVKYRLSYNWFLLQISFLSLRSSLVKINSSISTPFIITFIIYIIPIKSIFRKYPHIHYHLFADDLQIYTSFLIFCGSNFIQLSIFNCLTELTDWSPYDSLSLNMTKMTPSYSPDLTLLPCTVES